MSIENSLKEPMTKTQSKYFQDRLTSCMMSLTYVEKRIKKEKEAIDKILSEIRSIGVKKEVNSSQEDILENET